MNKREIGSYYEELAAVHPQKKGYRVLEQSYHYRQGEVGLIYTQGPYPVFVEVKYWTNSRIGDPLEAVNKRKQRRIHQAAAHYMYSHDFVEDCAYRFDVAGILRKRVELVQDAF